LSLLPVLVTDRVIGPISKYVCQCVCLPQFSGMG